MHVYLQVNIHVSTCVYRYIYIYIYIYIYLEHICRENPAGATKTTNKGSLLGVTFRGGLNPINWPLAPHQLSTATTV